MVCAQRCIVSRQMAKQNDTSQATLDETLAAVAACLRRYHPAAPLPLIVLDEANLMHDWGCSPGGDVALRSLLNFLLLITKQVSLS